MKIERDGSVIIPVELAGTFRDFSLPLVQRLEKLALLIGSDEWTQEEAPHAESLIREAALRLAGLMTEVSGRKSVLDAVTGWNNTLRVENARLLEFCDRLEEENRRLRDEAGEFWKTFG